MLPKLLATSLYKNPFKKSPAAAVIHYYLG